MVIIRKNAQDDKFYIISLNGGLNWMKVSKTKNSLEDLIASFKNMGCEVEVQD